MTPAKVEKINGHLPTITILPEEGRRSISITCDCGKEPVTIDITTTASKINMTLHVLVERVYKLHRQIRFELDGYRCTHCGGRIGLTADHIVSRAAGRDDRIDNLTTLCNGPGSNNCHDLRHKTRGFHKKHE